MSTFFPALKSKSVIILEPSSLLAETIKFLLVSHSDVRVGSATIMTSTAEMQAANLKADLLIADISMFNLCDLKPFLTKLKSSNPKMRMMAFCNSLNCSDYIQSLPFSPDSFLLKTTKIEEFSSKVRQLLMKK
jgi:DNA-binding NarL/FixJ family response regulator